MLVVLTELNEQAVGESLLPALPLITRSHLVVVAAVRDPDGAMWAAAVPTEAATAHRKAAASLDDHARLAARLLGGMGAAGSCLRANATG